VKRLQNLFRQAHPAWPFVLALLAFNGLLLALSALISFNIPTPASLLVTALLYAALNMLLLLPLWLAMRWQRKIAQLQQDFGQFETQLNQLLTGSHLPLAQDDSLTDKLLVLQQNQQALSRREQEIRHLVRVQGLIDHDLAIGNRIYFESKLQHYLVDNNETPFGAFFLVQISHPDIDTNPITAVQRLAGCAELLTQLTAHLPQAVLARLAENDLAVLLPGMEQKDAETCGDRMASILSRSSFFVDYPDFDVLHIGYVIYQHGQSAYQVMAEADMALKTAQLQGPNAAYGFYPTHKPKIKGSVWWRTELTNALKEQRFLLSFQPVFSWEQHDVIQHEVLVRLHTSESDKLNAAVFLPMAANCGLSQAIDQFVLQKTAKLCQAENIGQSRCSINLSVDTVLSKDWHLWLMEMLNSQQLQAGQFAFELDEYHLQKHYKKLKPKLIQLQKLGFALIVDHVGLTIETCPYLDELQIEAIKLHPSVVRQLDQQLEQQLFIRGLIASHFAKGVKVIATGVENQQEWQVLKKLGVSGAQGFYFSQPLARIIPQDQPV
jgi:RNase E specificity factor CsrD